MDRPVFACVLFAAFSLASFPSSASAQGEALGPTPEAVLFDFAEIRMRDSTPYIYRSEAQQGYGAWVARGFARCAVKLNSERARHLLDSSIAGQPHPVGYEQRYFRRLRTCTPSSGMADVGLVRGAVAERLLLSTRVPDGFRATSSVSELIEYLRFVEALEASEENLVTVTQLGYQCRAAVSPAAAYAVLRTEPESAEEDEALRDLDGRTSLCDVFFARGDDVNHWFRRAFVARGVYYWQRFLEV